MYLAKSCPDKNFLGQPRKDLQIVDALLNEKTIKYVLFHRTNSKSYFKSI